MKLKYKLKEAANVGNTKLIAKLKKDYPKIDLSFDKNYLLRTAVAKNNSNLVCYLLQSEDIKGISDFDNFCLKKAAKEGYCTILTSLFSSKKTIQFKNGDTDLLISLCKDYQTETTLRSCLDDKIRELFITVEVL